jgi:cobalt-zinc-cadmium efflux system outer membrane protein
MRVDDCGGLSASTTEEMAMTIRSPAMEAVLAGLTLFSGVSVKATGQGVAGASNRQGPPTRDASVHASIGEMGRSVSLTPALPHAPATPDPVSISTVPCLADFERIAMQRNPTLMQAAAQYEAAQSRSFQAGLYPNPVVGYVQDQIGSFSESRPSSSGFTVKGKPAPGDNVGAFVQQQIITAGKLRLSRAKFAEEANAARWQALAQELRVINSVRISFFEVLAAQRLVEIHRELSRLNDEAARTTGDLANVGQANEPDVLQARVEARRARVGVRNAENRFRAAWENLLSLIGAPELRPSPLDPAPLVTSAVPLNFDQTLADLLQHSPEIKAALSEIRRDQIMVRREKVEPIPNVFVQAVTGYNYEFGVQTAGVQVGVPLPVFNRNQGTVREAMSDLTRDRAEYERVALSLRQRLASAFMRFEDALQSVDDYRAESLPLARRAFEVQMANFQQRRAAWPQVLVAQRTYVDLNKDYVQSLLELRRAEVEIGGMLLVDGLSTPAPPTSQGHIESVPQPR